MEKSEREYLKTIAPQCERLWATFTPNMKEAVRKLHRRKYISSKTVPYRTIQALVKRRVLYKSQWVYLTRKPETVYYPTITCAELLGWLQLTRQLTKEKTNAGKTHQN